MERVCGRLKLVFAGWVDASRVCGKLTVFISKGLGWSRGLWFVMWFVMGFEA